ncbi:MAG: 16S rRNA (cytidine(1402)-2'-O)-methyltransferase [Patescibacteria group bacterium]
MLNIVATPIGNLKDITLRALEVFASADVIVCEDMRETLKILNHYNLKKKLLCLHQHSFDQKIRSILTEYENICYVTDAGTPGISDPGNRIVELAYEMGKPVVAIPGPSAIVAALSISGLKTDKFLFLGFMPHKGKGKTFEQIKCSQYTSAFYDSPHRVVKTLTELAKYISDDRLVVVAREITKMFESVYRGTITQVLEQIKDHEKGEFVVLVEGSDKRVTEQKSN